MSGRLHTPQGGMTTVAGNGTEPRPVATIGSIPMRPIAINIMKDVESQVEDSRDMNSDFVHGEGKNMEEL